MSIPLMVEHGNAFDGLRNVKPHSATLPELELEENRGATAPSSNSYGHPSAPSQLGSRKNFAPLQKSEVCVCRASAMQGIVSSAFQSARGTRHLDFASRTYFGHNFWRIAKSGQIKSIR